MKTLSKMMSIAVAAMAFTGCSSEPEVAPEMQPIRLELTAGTTTRTEIGPDNKISWSDTGETLKVLEQVGDATFSALDNDDYTKDPTSGKASFSVALPVKTGTSFRYATLHPKAAYVTNSNTNLAAIKFIVPDIQLPTATSFDPDADILVSKTITTEAQPTSLSLQFGRIIAIGKMRLTNLAVESDETISDITFTAPGKVVTGRGKFNFETGRILTDQWGYSGEGKDYVSMLYDGIAASAAFDAWFTCAPLSIAADETFTVKVTTSRGTYTRSVTISASGGLNFTLGDLTTFSVNMATAEFIPAVTDPSIFTITFGSHPASKVDYTPELNLGATGSSASNLTFAFSTTSDAIRSTNPLSGYDGASGGHGWWSGKETTLTLGSVNLNGKTNFALTFGAGAGATTIQASISKDGTHFFPLSQNDVAITADKSGTGLLKTVNFNLDATVTETVSIKFENTGTASCQLDDIKLMPLDAPAEGSCLIDWKAAPELKTTPDNGGSLNFAADNGSGAAPDSQMIEYAWIGDDCTFAFKKADADTWYTITQTDKGDGTGTLTIQPEIYTVTDADRSGTVTVSVMKNGNPVITHTITVTQLKTGAIVKNEYTATYTITSRTAVSTSGTAPNNSSAAYTQTYSTVNQMTKGNSATLTLTGYEGCTITGITLNMKSNKSSGSGNLNVTAGTTTISSIATSAFNTDSWAGKWSSAYIDVMPTVTPYAIQSGEIVTLTIAATANSLYIQSYTITYEN
ncbi:hypothetical protein [Alistipes shahii]|uniref:hypothetical protein n=2 Tax=Alistipes shahii TaxID=328814 RepID=UPI00266D6238|nr:hypothetical protein [Alistipes shahii]